MSASIAGSNDCEGNSAAMATPKVVTFNAIKNKNADLPPFSNLLHAVPWRVLEDGTELLAPRLKPTSDPFVINLTPSDDDWLKVQSGVNYVANLKPHHKSSETVACKVFLELTAALAKDVAGIDREIMGFAMTPNDMKKARGVNWMPMMRTETAMMANIVLEGSDALTKLCFIDADGSAHQGEGMDFFKAQLGEAKLEGFSCKVWISRCSSSKCMLSCTGSLLP